VLSCLHKPRHQETPLATRGEPHENHLRRCRTISFDSTAWFGLMAPAGTPAPIVAKLHAETAKILARADVREKFANLGMEVIGNTPAEFADVIKAETPVWAKIIKASGAKATE